MFCYPQWFRTISRNERLPREMTVGLYFVVCAKVSLPAFHITESEGQEDVGKVGDQIKKATSPPLHAAKTANLCFRACHQVIGFAAREGTTHWWSESNRR